MGNWRTVDMTGKINIEDVDSIRQFLWNGKGTEEAWCFTIDLSLCGLNNWIEDDGTIDVCGNLYERDCDNDDIETCLRVLASRYPSLELTLHSGSDYEGSNCTATFHVENGAVTRCIPEVEMIRPCRVLTIDEYFTLEKIYEKKGE